ncbi:hypothetical protein OS11_08710 [Dickeya oryzae]
MAADTYSMDELDRGILNALMDNARTPYAELAKQFSVSPGTIHVRVEKMKQAGIIMGTRLDVNPKQLGYDVCCFYWHHPEKRQGLSVRAGEAQQPGRSGRGVLHHRALQHLH